MSGAAPSRRRRWVRGILIGLACFIVVLLAGIVFLLTTNAGARFLTNLVLPRLPLQITIDRVDGRLTGPLVLIGVAVTNEQAELSVGTFRLDIAEGDLISKRIRITELRIEDMRLRALTPEEAEEQPKETEQAPQEPFNPPTVILDIGELKNASLVLPDSTQVNLASLRLSGTLNTYKLELTGSAAGPRVPDTSFELQGTGSLEHFDLELCHVEALDGTVDASGEVTWQPELKGSTRVIVAGINPALADSMAADWPGSISLKLTAEGGIDESGPAATAAITDMGGDLRGLPLSGSLRARWQGEEGTLDTLDAAWGPVTLKGTGAYGATVLADLALTADDLALVDTMLAGSVSLLARGEGPKDAIQLSVEAKGDSLSAPGYRLGTVRLEGQGNSNLTEPFLVDLTLNALDLDAGTVDSAAFHFDGTVEEHSVRLTAAGFEATTLLTLSGGWVDSSWTGTLDTLQAAHPLADTWESTAPASISAGPTGGSLDSLRLASDGAELLLSGRGAANGSWEGVLRLADLDLKRLVPDSTSENITLTGLLNASAEFGGTGPRALGKASVVVEACSVQVTGDYPAVITVDEFTVDTVIDEEALTASARVNVASEGAQVVKVEADARIAGFADADSLNTLPLEGSLQARMDDLSVLQKLAPRLQVAGELQADFTLGGTLGKPEAPGGFALTDGAFGIPELGVALNAVNVQAESDAASGYSLEGSAQAGEGTIELTGHSPTVPSVEEPVTAELKMNRAKLVETSEMVIYVDSDLKVRATPDTVEVTGDIGIPEATISLLEAPPSAVGPSGDVRFVGPEAEEPAPVAIPKVDVKVTMGEEVFFRGLNFSTRVEGSLRVKQVGTDPGTGTGEIRLTDGYYKAYGQDLKIENGRVIFAGSLENPGLDVTAFRIANDGTEAGVKVTGTAEVPIIELYTDPAKEQRDALAYIMTGRPLSAGSGEEQARVADAAAVIGSSMLTSKMGSKVGLDEVRVETGDTSEEASLVLGKYLNPRLFVSYGMGLFERSSTFTARYLLNPRWAVQTETGDATGADVLFRIETGQ